MRIYLIIPTALAGAAFVLSVLSLIAGYTPGFMDDFQFFSLDTSRLGQIVLAPGAITIGDQFSTQLGISSFYSFHAMNLCQGRFFPGDRRPGSIGFITFCTRPLSEGSIDLRRKLNLQLFFGPLRTTLDQIGVSPSIQQQLDEIQPLVRALAALLILSIAFTFFSAFFSLIGTLVIPKLGRTLSFFNLLLAFVSAVLLLAVSIVVTAGPREVNNQLLQRQAEFLGINLIYGRRLLALTWIAFVFMFVSTGIWFLELTVSCFRGSRRRDRSGERGGGGSPRAAGAMGGALGRFAGFTGGATGGRSGGRRKGGTARGPLPGTAETI